MIKNFYSKAVIFFELSSAPQLEYWNHGILGDLVLLLLVNLSWTKRRRTSSQCEGGKMGLLGKFLL